MKRVRAGFHGELGAFSQAAAKQLLGEGVKPIPYERFDLVFRALVNGDVDAAVIPIENTLHGSVIENYDHFLNFDVKIVGETKLRIVHNLIAPAGVKWSAIRRVFSHPVALNQCLDFFAANGHLEKTTFYDTAGSVKMVVEQGLTDAAAIASSMAAEIYGARILKKGIEDDRQNFTRFFLAQRPGDKPLLPQAGEKKTSLVFTTRNTPGALFRALSAFALRDLSLEKIESRPLRGKPWEYLFYVDVLADLTDEKTKRALGHLEELADFLKVFGCYPKAKS